MGKLILLCMYRSVLVHLDCGEDNEILSLDEPSTCVYEMTVSTPLACTAQVLAKAQKTWRFGRESTEIEQQCAHK